MIELEECLNLSNNYSIMFNYGIIDWSHKNEVMIHSPTKDVANAIECIISSNEKQNGLHIFQMYKYKNRIINLTTFIHLANLNVEGLQVFNHLGYHVNMYNKVFCCFFTSKPTVTYYGISDTILNIKLEGKISHCNKMMVYESSDFVSLFGIINDPSMLPISLRNLSVNNLHDLTWKGFLKSIENEWYLYSGNKFMLLNDEVFRYNIEFKSNSLNYENHHKFSIQRFENRDGLSNHSSLSFKKSRLIGKNIIF